MSANGRLTAAELEVVEDNDRLNHGAAGAFRRARAAYYAEGGSGACIVEPGGSYRDWDTQYAMKHGIPSYAYWNLNPNSKIGLADPGGSTHGLGDSFDALAGFNAFLRRRGGEFGLYRPYGDRDPNHWRWNGYTPASVAGASPLTANDLGIIRRRRGDTMYTHFRDDPAIAKGQVPSVYAIFRDANGQGRLALCGPMEAAIAYAGNASIPADAGTINGVGDELGYKSTDPRPRIVPTVAATVDLSGVELPPADNGAVLAAIADTPRLVAAELKKEGN